MIISQTLHSSDQICSRVTNYFSSIVVYYDTGTTLTHVVANLGFVYCHLHYQDREMIISETLCSSDQICSQVTNYFSSTSVLSVPQESIHCGHRMVIAYDLNYYHDRSVAGDAVTMPIHI